MDIAPANLFSSLANETRLRSLMLLLRHDELCVCELTHALGVAQPHISRHLALLRESGLVSDRREGLWVYYRIHPDLPEWVRRVLQDIFAGISGRAPFHDDAKVLSKMPNRPGAPRCA
jgi:ArsR family transcriptional regulator